MAISSTSVPEEILNDLSTRFLIHLPPEEKKDPTRLCFQIELAYWFYLDYYAGEGSGLPNLSMRDFTHALFGHIPGLRKYSKRTDDIIATWKQFKFAVPTFGCILVDDSLEQILLVQGYWSRGSWGFPKGKINENEKPHRCAAREVEEETGFDCLHMISKKLFLERRVGDHAQRLYLVPGVSRDTVFLPQTKKEIRSIRWFQVRDLPAFKKDPTPTERLGINSNAFFMVMPFVKPLKKWLNQLRQTTGKSPLSMLKTPKPPSEVGSVPKQTVKAVTPTAGDVSSVPVTQSQKPATRDASSSTPATAANRRASAEQPARRSLSKIFDEAAKLHTSGSSTASNSSNNNNGSISCASSNNSNNGNNSNNNVLGADQAEGKATINSTISHSKTPKNKPQSKQGGKKNDLAIGSAKYKAPDFEISAWTNFKLNYEEYVKLVY